MGELTRLADEMDASLWTKLIDPWFPACEDPAGGFHQRFDSTWRRLDEDSRFVVFQSRMTWVASILAQFDGNRGSKFRALADHGVTYLTRHFVDGKTGAVAWLIDLQGNLASDRGIQRHTYGTAFCIFALATAHRTTGSELALRGAQRAFEWLEKFAHDAVYGGYREHTEVDGSPSRRTIWPRMPEGAKSQNTHLHLLEALTELYRVWPTPVVEERLCEVVEVIHSRLFDPRGSLYMFVREDWTPIEGPVSFGHDIEASHLLLEAAKRLPSLDTKKLRETARSLVTHTIEHGVDRVFGGVFNIGTREGAPMDGSKVWWVQAEALLGFAASLLLDEQDEEAREVALISTWSWIRDRQIDAAVGGWYDTLSTDGTPTGRSEKGHRWKAAYHETRALLETSRILREVSQRPPARRWPGPRPRPDSMP